MTHPWPGGSQLHAGGRPRRAGDALRRRGSGLHRVGDDAAVAPRFRGEGLAVDAAGVAVWDLDVVAGEVAHSPDLNRMLGFPEMARR
jgi:hypothetical protein